MSFGLDVKRRAVARVSVAVAAVVAMDVMVAGPFADSAVAVGTSQQPVGQSTESALTARANVVSLAQLSAVAILSRAVAQNPPAGAWSVDPAQLVAAATPQPDPVATGPLPPLARYSFSARFGQSGSWASGYHTGLDFAAPQGAPIRAVESGVVAHAGLDEVQGAAYGNLIRLAHSPTLQTWYAHISEVLVKKGQRVTKGQVIGRVGSTGRSTGPHLHMEVRIKAKNPAAPGLDPYGYRAVDPEKFLWPTGRVA